MPPVEILGAVAGTLTTVAFLPQVVRLWRRRSARDLSLAWIVTFTSGVALWLAYGIALASRPILIANAVTLGLMLLILYFKLRER